MIKRTAICLLCLSAWVAPVFAGDLNLAPSPEPLASGPVPVAAAAPVQQEIHLDHQRHREDSETTIASLAEDLSYLGAVLLTAHHIMASVRSWTDVLEYNGAEGASLELTKTPKGMGLMLQMSMPLD